MKQAEPATTLQFLDRDKEVTQADFEALGPGPKVIVVDDAHDRERLGLLFAFAADPSRQARVLVSTRPYAQERIRQEAATYSITDIPTVWLGSMGRASLVALAEEILAEYEGESSWAAEIVARESDSPLATALFARMAGRDGMPPERARSTADVKHFTAGKFTGVLLGELGLGSDASVNREVLEVLALVQPFHPEDPGLLAAEQRQAGRRGPRRPDAPQAGGRRRRVPHTFKPLVPVPGAHWPRAERRLWSGRVGKADV